MRFVQNIPADPKRYAGHTGGNGSEVIRQLFRNGVCQRDFAGGIVKHWPQSTLNM